MPFNLSPNGNSRRIGLGTGVLQLRQWDGVTPSASDDVGYGNNSTLVIARTKVDVLQGVPKSLVARFATQETVTQTFAGIEWNSTLLANMLGGGVVTGSGNDTTMGFGGSIGFTD